MYDDFRKFFDDIKDNWIQIRSFFRFASSRYFYKEDFIYNLISSRTFKYMYKDDFIDYSLAYKYYSNERKKIKIQTKNGVEEIEIPYSELIDFISNPDTQIIANKDILEYHLSQEIIKETDNVLKKFRKDRPKTTNGNILRIKSFIDLKKNNYKIVLESCNYYDLIRTNNTLDHPLGSDSLKTLRISDLNDSNELKPFSESILVNSIGVSSILVYQNAGRLFFYLKPRKDKLGISNKMLATVSGVVEPPENNEIKENLINHVTEELMRELSEETGLQIEDIKKNPKFRIIPLALTRELIRGGKPQLFYLIMIEEVNKREFKKLFQKSSAKDEFRDDWLTNITSYNQIVSPEFTSNLLYAIRYIQKVRKLDNDVVKI